MISRVGVSVVKSITGTSFKARWCALFATKVDLYELVLA